MTFAEVFNVAIWFIAPIILFFAIIEARVRGKSIQDLWFWIALAGGLSTYSIWNWFWIGVPIAVCAASLGFIGQEACLRWAEDMTEWQQDDDD